MSWRSAMLLLAAVTLGGCAGQQTGPTFAALTQTLGPPKGGQARIVVLRREKGVSSVRDYAIPVILDGRPVGDLLTGTFAFVDRPAGRHLLSADVASLPGAATEDFVAAAGRIYFFAVTFNDNVDKLRTGVALGGLLGKTLAVAATGENHGGIALAAVDEASARAAIAELRQAH